MRERVSLKAIRALANAATPGEWRSRRHGRVFSITNGLPGSMLIIADVFDDRPEFGGTPGKPDADFIAAARTDVPALCDEVERLRDALFNIAHMSRVCSVDDAIAEAREALNG